MTDRYLLEAMREVDELTPACPPIAPEETADEKTEHIYPDRVLLTHQEVSLCRKAGLSLRRYAELKQAQLMQNAANRSMTPGELARYNRGRQNAARPTTSTDSEDKP